jgi:hypothetical protein
LKQLAAVAGKPDSASEALLAQLTLLLATEQAGKELALRDKAGGWPDSASEVLVANGITSLASEQAGKESALRDTADQAGQLSQL